LRPVVDAEGLWHGGIISSSRVERGQLLA